MKTTKHLNTAGRQPLASKGTNLSIDERKALLVGVSKQLISGKLTKGAALKQLRLNLFSVSQADYASMVGIGRKALSEIENDKGNYTEAFLQKAFRPVGLQVSVIPKDLRILEKVINDSSSL